MSNEDLAQGQERQPHSAVEVEGSSEVIEREPRLLVYGSRMSGSHELADALEAGLESYGLRDPKVAVLRDVSYIRDAFFGRSPGSATHTPALAGQQSLPEATGDPVLVSEKHGKLRGLVRKLGRQGVTASEEGTGHASTLNPDTLPAGVLILPEMRQYSAQGGMTIPTPAEAIEELCKRYHVPFVRVERLETPEQAQQGIEHLLADQAQNQLNP